MIQKKKKKKKNIYIYIYIKAVVLVPVLLRQTCLKMDERLNGSKSDGRKKKK